MPYSALPALKDLETAHPACTDQSPSTDPAPLYAEKMNSASKASALLAPRAATVANIILKTVFNVLKATSRPAPSARRVASTTNSTTITRNAALPALQVVLLALPTATAPAARTPPLHPEEEFAQIAPILVLLVTDLVHALHVSADSTTSKEPAGHPVLPVLHLLTVFVNAHLE